MKKILTLVLVVAMVATLAVTALAADKTDKVGSVTAGNNVSTGEITITTNTVYTEYDPVYSVDVEWKNTAITVTKTISGATWDAETHTWKNGSTSYSWSNEGKVEVIVTNHSNDEILAKLTKPADQDGVTFTANTTEFTLEDASAVALGNVAGADSDSFVIQAAGAPTADLITVNATVTITAAP
jgi:hypothetical protein